MTDPISILADNLTEALRHVNAYLALGLVSAVSAFVLDRQPADREETAPVSVLGGFVQARRRRFTGPFVEAFRLTDRSRFPNGGDWPE